LRWLFLQQINSEDSRGDCTYGIPRHWDVSTFAALGAQHSFLHTVDRHRKTTWSVEYDYGKFIVVASLSSRCTSRDP
jgi:hypothetical protein